MKIAYYTGWTLTRVITTLFFRIKVIGRQHFPKEGPFIVATNHRSYFDPLLVGSWCSRQVYFLAKKELFENWLFGALITSTNALPVKRGAIDRNAVKACVGVLERGYGLTVFPEGTRARDREFLDPKPGIGIIATQAKVPIVPGYVHGSNKLKNCLLGRDHLSIHFGEPIPAEFLAGLETGKEAYFKVAEKVMERIRELRNLALSS